MSAVCDCGHDRPHHYSNSLGILCTHCDCALAGAQGQAVPGKPMDGEIRPDWGLRYHT